MCACLGLAATPTTAVEVSGRATAARGHAEVVSALRVGATHGRASEASHHRRNHDSDDDDDEDDEVGEEEEKVEDDADEQDGHPTVGAGSATDAAVTAARWKEDVGEADPMPPTLEPGSTAEKAAIVVATRRLLQENRVHQATLRGLVSELENSTHFHQKLHEEVAKASNETAKNKAVIEVLGKMWSEMRRYSSPFFLEHAKRQQDWLEHREPELTEELGAAEAALRSHYRKVTVDAPEERFSAADRDIPRSGVHREACKAAPGFFLLAALLTTLAPA